MAKNAWQVRKQGGKGFTRVSLQNTAPYSGVLERGARPHPVSAEGWLSIFRWVLRNLADEIRISKRKHFIATARRTNVAQIGPGRFAVGKQSGGQRLATNRVATQITNAIVWKLNKYGQVGRYFVRDSMPKITTWAHREIKRQLKAYFTGGGRP
jgi:hypothetical protein